MPTFSLLVWSSRRSRRAVGVADVVVTDELPAATKKWDTGIAMPKLSCVLSHLHRWLPLGHALTPHPMAIYHDWMQQMFKHAVQG